MRARFWLTTVLAIVLIATIGTAVASQSLATGTGPSHRQAHVARVGSESAATGSPTLVDRAKEAGLARRHITWGASEVDYNNDGRLDVWIGRHYVGGDLWRNTGRGGYVRVRTPAWPHHSTEGKAIDRHDCQWADVDRNGLADAYCSAGRFTANFVKTGRDNELWLQRPLGTFHDVGTEWGVGDICGRGRNVAFVNANGDRWPDLFLGNETPRDQPDPCNRHPGRYPNENSKIFINQHGTGFAYVRRFFDYGAGPGERCAELIDYDGDGWDDLLTCGTVGGPAKSGMPPSVPLQLFRNRQGAGFVDRSDLVPTVVVEDAVPGDIDSDGDPDIIFATRTGFFYSLNTNGHLADPVTIGVPSSGVGRAVAVGDADRDSDLDVYGVIGHRFNPNPDDMLYLNDGLTFTPLEAPTTTGTADEVIAVHPGPSVKADFLVLNGFHHADPRPTVQLIDLIS
jgi:hypothetical protein